MKFGLNTKFPKHINLKILKAHCRFATLPPDKWLTKPGQHQAESRLDEEERKLKEEINTPGHDLVWNRKAGRDESKPESYGWIYCQKCQRTWPWCKRHANIPRSVCRKLPNSQPTPQWVLDLNINQPSNSSEPAPRRRIRGKSTPTNSHRPTKRFVSLPPHRLQESTHIQELASDSQLFACSGDAVCIGAATSPYYFWDPAGSPAPTHSYQTYMPEVMGGCVARQCTSHEVCASEFASRSVGIIDYMVMCCLVTSLCAFLWQIVPIVTMPIMAYERVQRFARKAMTPFFWSSLFFRTNSKKWILPARFVGRMRVTSKKQPRKHNNLRPRNVAIVKLMSCTVIFLHVLLMIYVSWEMFGQIQEIDNDFCLRKHVHNSLYMIFGICWFLTRLIRNRMVHALTGNGGPTAKGSKGGGKNAYNTAAQVDPEIAFAQAMKTAMPEAAKIRMQPKLIQSQWTQTIKEWQHLDATGGVAIAPKESIPTILAKVGYSSKPTAILIVQEPDELGMVGYPRTRVKCSYDVVSTGGIRKQVEEVERWLVQLGFSEQVSMQPIGDEVQVGFTMTRMVAKFSVHRGWAHGPHPAGVLANHLQQFVDEHAFDSIMSRGDGSFLFLVHNTFEDELLSKSGANGIFLKRHVSEIDMGHELFLAGGEHYS